MKTFSQKTKEVLCKIETGSLCCCEAEMMGILMFAGRFKGAEVRISLENRETINRFAELALKCLGVKTEVLTQKNSFYCVLKDKKLLTKIIEYDNAEDGFEKIVAKNECCRDSFLRGAFLGG